MNRLSCLTCQINLSSSNDQREHYKSEWHLYNLKRKLNQLKSINEDEFNQIKIKHTISNNDNNDPLKKEGVEESFYCDVCRKNFLNQKAYEQHNSSNKHLRQMDIAARLLNRYQHQKQQQQQKMKSNADDDKPKQNDKDEEEEFNESDWEEMDTDDDDEEEEIFETIPLNECLFCSHQSIDMETNIQHMATIHSFFIPDIEYCSNLKGLLNYLGTKIADGHCCLWCSDNGKTFSSTKSTQQHMLDVGHTKINFYNRTESLIEFEDFYDYSSSYPTTMDDQTSKQTETEQQQDDDDEIDLNILDDDNYQLRLPSGKIIGHRSLMIYYRQKLRPQSQQQLVATTSKSNHELMNRIKHGYRMIGGGGGGWNCSNVRSGSSNELISHQHQRQQFIRDKQYIDRLRQKWSVKLGQKSNQTLQKHFRCQMGFK
ncbi:cytoplasmic 60S subunit biogenesis factor ZNF622 [Dermatophagoides pteronyssinus]|uniref:cytoplasmic 60S subunit biogenesis factor ZNF622 n=1 Tax=Dermatophagoides pteronyssinus TaxID=6956 RepID=UPI003F6644AA